MKDPAELTQSERAAIALAAGCPMVLSWEDQRLVFTTRNPVGIGLINGRYVVVEGRVRA